MIWLRLQKVRTDKFDYVGVPFAVNVYVFLPKVSV
jgi:hypothetical protein